MHHMRTWVSRRGATDWETLIATMPPEDQDVLRALVPVGWYDLGLQHRLLRQIDQHFGRGDGALVDEIGVFEADQDLTVVHRLFLRLANPAFVLEKSGEYWSRFYDTGRWTIERRGRTGARGVLSEVEPFDPLFGRYLTAYIRRMWELVGARDLQVDSRIEGTRVILLGSWR